MITYTITDHAVPMSDAVREYVEKRFKGFERFMDDKTDHEITVTISKLTAHQREDSVQVEVSLKIHTKDFLVRGVGSEVLAAIDMAKEELMREVTHSKAKRITLFHHGARKVKNMIKNMYPSSK